MEKPKHINTHNEEEKEHPQIQEFGDVLLKE
jgi:hypothetical protein